jgi:hypothetical protein
MKTSASTWRLRGGIQVQLYSWFNLGSRWGWLVQGHDPAALRPGKRPDIHCGWVGPRAGMDGLRREKFACFCRESNLRSSIAKQNDSTATYNSL